MSVAYFPQLNDVPSLAAFHVMRDECHTLIDCWVLSASCETKINLQRTLPQQYGHGNHKKRNVALDVPGYLQDAQINPSM
jgi:hypothetical protein